MGKKQRAKAKRMEKKLNPPKQTKKPKKEASGDLFSNPMSKAAMSAMSDEDLQKYKQIGEELYGHLNFEDGKTLKNLAPPMAESVAYLESQIDAGLHISELKDNETALMVEAYGATWYEMWGFVEGDLVDIVTVQPYRR